MYICLLRRPFWSQSYHTCLCLLPSNPENKFKMEYKLVTTKRIGSRPSVSRHEISINFWETESRWKCVGRWNRVGSLIPKYRQTGVSMPERTQRGPSPKGESKSEKRYLERTPQTHPTGCGFWLPDLYSRKSIRNRLPEPVAFSFLGLYSTWDSIKQSEPFSSRGDHSHLLCLVPSSLWPMISKTGYAIRKAALTSRNSPTYVGPWGWGSKGWGSGSLASCHHQGSGGTVQSSTAASAGHKSRTWEMPWVTQSIPLKCGTVWHGQIKSNNNRVQGLEIFTASSSSPTDRYLTLGSEDACDDNSPLHDTPTWPMNFIWPHTINP